MSQVIYKYKTFDPYINQVSYVENGIIITTSN